MSESTPRRARRQRLGMRLGPEPYYALAEHTGTRLVLESRPEANKPAGYLLMARGAIFALVALFALCVSLITLVQNIDDAVGVVVLSTVCAGLLGGLAFSGLVGGWGIASTRNTIVADASAQTVVYTQRNRVLRQTRERTQTLPFAHIVGVCLRPRPFLTSGLRRRREQIMALELVTDDQQVWVVDSARDPAALMPTATALATVLGLELKQEP